MRKDASSRNAPLSGQFGQDFDSKIYILQLNNQKSRSETFTTTNTETNQHVLVICTLPTYDGFS